eukprot:GHVQ01028190.1.p1 GENE.GHVQ01028190.1~~GHVQ01028190.1.p1  ORF type:complete len:198 (+),score=34.89 GHVQ01028190.1:314-907(+)
MCEDSSRWMNVQGIAEEDIVSVFPQFVKLHISVTPYRSISCTCIPPPDPDGSISVQLDRLGETAVSLRLPPDAVLEKLQLKCESVANKRGDPGRSLGRTGGGGDSGGGRGGGGRRRGAGGDGSGEGSVVGVWRYLKNALEMNMVLICGDEIRQIREGLDNGWFDRVRYVVCVPMLYELIFEICAVCRGHCVLSYADA